MRSTRFEHVLQLGDDALVAAQRLSEWVSRAPELEEDMALANIALDELGQARLLLSYAAEIEGAGRTEDDLAYLRTDREFRNCQLVELPDSRSAGGGAPDFAVTIAKLLCFSAYQHLLYQRLSDCGDERLAAIARKAVKETAYHLDHATLWTLRLGDGTEESHRRVQAAVDEVWPYTHELFEADDRAEVDPASLRDAWLSTVEKVLAEATLTRPGDGWAPTGGRSGIHTEALSYLLGEMQSLHRAHPGATW
ncbi:MAG: phenylacetate-CoA oxygenase subunit PaaC [Micromonosporaceae bacterium]|nr:phenylacetate-CoA oxygenase subunit PaaC [Micromonosporaceae bacterium]